MLKANNQPYKNCLGLAFSWVNVVKNCKILTFKVNVLRQKLSKSFKKILIRDFVKFYWLSLHLKNPKFGPFFEGARSKNLSEE